MNDARDVDVGRGGKGEGRGWKGREGEGESEKERERERERESNQICKEGSLPSKTRTHQHVYATPITIHSLFIPIDCYELPLTNRSLITGKQPGKNKNKIFSNYPIL